MNQFAEWLSRTSPSVFIQNHNGWVIPMIQSIHIVGIAVVIGTALMISLRILGVSGMDQTMPQTMNRFGPWLSGTLWLLLATGILLVIGEPVRELVTFSFWLKMLLVAVMALLAGRFRSGLRKQQRIGASVRWMTVLSFVIWACIIVLGRLIAYDHVWGSWSPAKKA